MKPYMFSQEYAVVCLIADEDAPLTVMNMAESRPEIVSRMLTVRD